MAHWTWEAISPEQIQALMQAYDRDFAKPWVGDRNGAETCCDAGLLLPVVLQDRVGIDGIAYSLTREGADIVRAMLKDESDRQRHRQRA